MQHFSKLSIFFYISILFFSCSSGTINDSEIPPNEPFKKSAKIVSVSSQGSENKYNFSVGISSPDKGCSQYADWWEVITEDGKLIYRRILAHSHVNEQPFVRSGGNVNILKDQVVIIRVHMNNSGYSLETFKGSVSNGFQAFKTSDNFAIDLANKNPKPSGCAF